MADAPVVVPDPSPAAAAPVADPAAVAAAPVLDKPAEAAPAAAVAPVIPEKYDFAALKLPEGYALNPALIDAVGPVLKKLGATQELANELVEAHAKSLAEVTKASEVKAEADFKAEMAKRMTEYQTTVKAEWGTNYDSNLATAQRGLARFASPALKTILDETGLGSHPEMLKAFLAAGRMVSEDTPPANGLPAGTRKSNAEVFYSGATQ